MSEFGIVTIVQCRVGSSRLPGKALKSLGGRTMLEHVLERAQAIGWPVIVATSVNRRDDAVEKVAKRCGVTVYRGDERDVLGRMSEAAKQASARIVIRLTADCPLLDPEVAREVLHLYIRSGHVIASNDTSVSGWPDGMDVEVFQAADLHEAAATATAQKDREHVTLWLRRHLPHVVLDGPEGSAWPKLSVDTPEDYERVKTVFSRLGESEHGWPATLRATTALRGSESPPTASKDEAPALPPRAIKALRDRGLSPRTAAAYSDEQLLEMKGIGTATVDLLRDTYGGQG